MTHPKVHQLISDLHSLFGDSEFPDEFSYEGQTFIHRCEGWLLHTIEQLEAEIQEFPEYGRDPRQPPDECPQCGSDRVALVCCVNGHEFYHCDECFENDRLAVIHGSKNRFGCPYCDDEEQQEAEND